jgi:hypothetical protein
MGEKKKKKCGDTHRVIVARFMDLPIFKAQG